LSPAVVLLIVAGCSSIRTDKITNMTTVVSTSPSSPSPFGLLEVVRATLGSEGWQSNHAWTANAEWEHRRIGFPLARDLRWRFAGDWDASIEKDETSSSIDTPADGSKRSLAPQSKPAKDDSSDNHAKTAATKTNTDATTATSNKADEKSSDQTSPKEDGPHWDGFWPLTVAELIHPPNKSLPAAMSEGVRCLRHLAHSDNLVGWNAAIIWAQQDPVSAVEIADVLQRLVVNPPQYLAEGSEASSVVKDGSPKLKQGPASQSPDARNSSSVTDVGDKSGKRDLEKVKTRKSLSATTRCAAAEAWCLVLAASAADPIDGLAPAGRLLEYTGLPNDVRAEIFRGVARWVRPANIPRLENAFREGQGKLRPPVMIRRAAIDACLIYAIWNQPLVRRQTETHEAGRNSQGTRGARLIWPETVLNCRIDPDIEVRRAFIAWLGFAQIEEAFELLKTQVEGKDFGLRRAAFVSLGTLHTDEAHTELKTQATKAREALRAAAVEALGTWGPKEITSFARDSSAVVRRTVACELAKAATLDSAVVLSELTVDRSTEVQFAAVRAASDWPDALAFPLLLHAMRDSSAKTRHEAAQLLSARRKVTTTYRFDSPSDRREAAVTAIAAEIGSSLSYLDQVLKQQPRTVAEANALRTAEVRAHLAALIENPADSPAAAGAREWLAGMSARDVPVVESYLQEPNRTPPEVIYHEVLPKVSPVYAALLDLHDADVNIRRRGVKILADRGQAATLSRPVLLRLRELLSHESDDLVWRLALAAVASDSTDDCANLANLALQQSSAVVRQLGCDYLAHHGRPAHALWLLDLIEDRNRTVQLAAIRALGNCGNQVAIHGLKPQNGGRTSPNLRSLLTSSDQEVRFSAAVSLCRLGAAEGMQEMVRLSYHPNPSLRERTVKEMGLSGQTRFVDHLVTLGWTERDNHVRQAILEALDRLVPPENRPPAIGGATAWDAKIKGWVQWLERRNGAPAQNLPAEAPLASRPGRES
jgi:HEAT repeat protein